MGPAPMRTHSATTGTNAGEFRRIEVITGVGRRRRWTDEDKARIVAESLDPATTSSAVARRYGLHQGVVMRQNIGKTPAISGRFGRHSRKRSLGPGWQRSTPAAALPMGR